MATRGMATVERALQLVNNRLKCRFNKQILRGQYVIIIHAKILFIIFKFRHKIGDHHEVMNCRKLSTRVDGYCYVYNILNQTYILNFEDK